MNEPGLGMPMPEEPEQTPDSVTAAETDAAAPGGPDAVVGPRSAAPRGEDDGGPAPAGPEAAETGAEADDADDAEARAAEAAEAEAARERAVFDELVASFHTETAPDPIPRKIIRYPVLNTEPVWDEPIVEPTDEMVVDKYFPSEHFEPPEPPPLPEVNGATKAAWTMVIGGVLFLVCRTLFEWQTEEWTFWLAVFGVFGGIVALVARMRPDRDDYDDPDHGAVV